MKPIVILADSRHRARCRSCGAAVEWATVAASQKKTLFNAPIVLMPSLPLNEAIGVVQVDMTQTTSHFATCPDHKQWRKRR